MTRSLTSEEKLSDAVTALTECVNRKNNPLYGLVIVPTSDLRRVIKEYKRMKYLLGE